MKRMIALTLAYDVTLVLAFWRVAHLLTA